MGEVRCYGGVDDRDAMVILDLRMLLRKSSLDEHETTLKASERNWLLQR